MLGLPISIQGLQCPSLGLLGDQILQWEGPLHGGLAHHVPEAGPGALNVGSQLLWRVRQGTSQGRSLGWQLYLASPQLTL